MLSALARLSRQHCRFVQTRSYKNRRRFKPRRRDAIDLQQVMPDDTVSTKDDEMLEGVEDVFDDLMDPSKHSRHLPTQGRKTSEKQLQAEFLKKNIIQSKERKFYNPKEPSLLTWAAKMQIKHLNTTDPIYWTPDMLADSFPVTKSSVIQVLKNKRIPENEAEIARHDRTVHNNWLKLKQVVKKMEDNPEGFSDLNEEERVLVTYGKNILHLIQNAAGNSTVPMPPSNFAFKTREQIAEENKLVVKPIFSSILTNYEENKSQLKNTPHKSKPIGFNEDSVRILLKGIADPSKIETESTMQDNEVDVLLFENSSDGNSQNANNINYDLVPKTQKQRHFQNDPTPGISRKGVFSKEHKRDSSPKWQRQNLSTEVNNTDEQRDYFIQETPLFGGSSGGNKQDKHFQRKAKLFGDDTGNKSNYFGRIGDNKVNDDLGEKELLYRGPAARDKKGSDSLRRNNQINQHNKTQDDYFVNEVSLFGNSSAGSQNPGMGGKRKNSSAKSQHLGTDGIRTHFSARSNKTQPGIRTNSSAGTQHPGTEGIRTNFSARSQRPGTEGIRTKHNEFRNTSEADEPFKEGDTADTFGKRVTDVSNTDSLSVSDDMKMRITHNFKRTAHVDRLNLKEFKDTHMSKYKRKTDYIQRPIYVLKNYGVHSDEMLDAITLSNI